jgi:hypothetical protein
LGIPTCFVPSHPQARYITHSTRRTEQPCTGIKVTPRAFFAFASLVASYFLAAISYEAFVAPYQDLWPADFKLISILLIMSPPVLLLARGISGDKAGMSRRSALLMLFSANVLFVATTCFRFYWTIQPLVADDFRPILWAGVWLFTPFVLVEIPRVFALATARTGYPRAVLLATPASIDYLGNDPGIASVMGRSFDSQNIYGLGAAAAFADLAIRGDLRDLSEAVRRRGLKKIILASLKRETGLVENVANSLMPLAIDVYSYAIDENGTSDENEVKLVLRGPLSSAGLAFKGLEDFCLGAVLTFFFAPLMGFIALAIWFDSPGPILFKQKRHGYPTVRSRCLSSARCVSTGSTMGALSRRAATIPASPVSDSSCASPAWMSCRSS